MWLHEPTRRRPNNMIIFVWLIVGNSTPCGQGSPLLLGKTLPTVVVDVVGVNPSKAGGVDHYGK